MEAISGLNFGRFLVIKAIRGDSICRGSPTSPGVTGPPAHSPAGGVNRFGGAGPRPSQWRLEAQALGFYEGINAGDDRQHPQNLQRIEAADQGQLAVVADPRRIRPARGQPQITAAPQQALRRPGLQAQQVSAAALLPVDLLASPAKRLRAALTGSRAAMAGVAQRPAFATPPAAARGAPQHPGRSAADGAGQQQGSAGLAP